MDIIDDIYCRDNSGKVVHATGENLIHNDGTRYVSKDIVAQLSHFWTQKKDLLRQL